MVKSDNTLLFSIVAIVILFFFSINNTSDSMSQSSSGDCIAVWKQDMRYDSVTFCTAEEAIAKAGEIDNCEGFHTHIQDGEIVSMSCKVHEDLDLFVLGPMPPRSY